MTSVCPEGLVCKGTPPFFKGEALPRRGFEAPPGQAGTGEPGSWKEWLLTSWSPPPGVGAAAQRERRGCGSPPCPSTQPSPQSASR